jgi:ribosome biogenesis protein NSA1
MWSTEALVTIRSAEVRNISRWQCLHYAQQSTTAPSVATGGKENKLKLWDLDRPDAPVFTAKNVRNDWLNLRVPEWVTDVTFIPDSQRIVTSTNDHEVRVYDPSSHCRRPVVSILFDESRITSMCLRPNNPHQVFVGNVHGGMALIDLRAKGKVVQHYKGAEGSIRDVCCHPSQNVVASCGLDRFLRIHDIDSREVLHKFYLKSRANAMLYSDKSRPVDSTTENTSAVTEMLSDEDTDDKLVQHRDNNDEELWAKMAPVPTTEAKQKVASKHQKGLTDDATVDKIDTASNERHNKKRSRQSSRKSAKLQKKNLALSEDGS